VHCVTAALQLMAGVGC